MRCTVVGLLFALVVALVPADDLRVISLAPSTTEIVFALGRGDWLVGRTEHCRWPASAEALPSVGSYFNLDREAVLALEPDLAVGVNLSEADRELLDAAGIELLLHRSERLAGVQEAIRAIASRLDCPASGEGVIAEMDREFEVIRTRLAEVPPKRTLMIVGHEPDTLRNLYAVGEGSWMNDLLTMAGGENALEATLGPFPEISLETVLVTDPEVILDTTLQLGEVTPERRERLLRAFEERLGAMHAVQGGDIILWTDAHLGIPGPSMPAQVRALSERLHPEVWGSADE